MDRSSKLYDIYASGARQVVGMSGRIFRRSRHLRRQVVFVGTDESWQRTISQEYAAKIDAALACRPAPIAVTAEEVDQSEFSSGMKRLMKYLIKYDSDNEGKFDTIFEDALDARDRGDVIKAESLYLEAIEFAHATFGENCYSLMPVLLHYADFLQSQDRHLDSEPVLNRFHRISALYDP